MPGAFVMPQPPQQFVRPQPQPQLAVQNQPKPPAPTQWQQAPPPSVVRGVAPTAPTAPPKFVLPTPQALGVATSVNVPTAETPVRVDWNQIQSRLQRLNVVEYHKVAASTGGIQVTLVLPQRQRIDATGETEAAAIMNALQQAERRQ
jgi:hypothetical protein